MRHTIVDASQLELNEKVVDIKRVTKVVKGGRNFRFSALVVVGDGQGHVGAGIGKSIEIPEAIRKGKEAAMKQMVTVPIDNNDSIPHDYIGKFGSASVLLKKAPEGTGVIAGGPARVVLEMAGIKNIRTKSLGSNNKQNVVLATITGLSQLKTPEEVARLRGKSVKNNLSRSYANYTVTVVECQVNMVYVQKNGNLVFLVDSHEITHNLTRCNRIKARNRLIGKNN